MFLEYINLIIEILELKVGYTITLQNKIMSGSRAEYCSEHSDSGRLRKHCIVIATKGIEDDARNLETLIAHEFIHAWQAEYKPNSAVHGKVFQRKAEYLYDALMGAGIENISPLYIKSVDKLN